MSDRICANVRCRHPKSYIIAQSADVAKSVVAKRATALLDFLKRYKCILEG